MLQVDIRLRINRDKRSMWEGALPEDRRFITELKGPWVTNGDHEKAASSFHAARSSAQFFAFIRMPGCICFHAMMVFDYDGVVHFLGKPLSYLQHPIRKEFRVFVHEICIHGGK